MGGGFGPFGFGWGMMCEECKVPRHADHTDGQGTYYCKAHYLIHVKGYSECPGCLTTGKTHSNGLPVQGSPICPLCRGEGVIP